MSRGRPKSDDKRRRIFASAIDLFTSAGYDGTSMDRVAEAASVSKQTVYSHFRDKDALFRAVVDELCETIGMPRGGGDDTRPIGATLEDIGTRFLRLLTSSKALQVYRLVLASVTRHPEAGRSFYQSGPAPFIERLAERLQIANDRGELAIADPRLAAAQFFALLRGELHLRVVLGVAKQPSRREIERYVDACVALFVRGYRPRTAQTRR